MSKIVVANCFQETNSFHPNSTTYEHFNVHFGQDLTAIVITGPNTGGKTIMLKTLGLTQVMAQSGLPILADKGSRVGIFEEIFADIGDEIAAYSPWPARILSKDSFAIR